MNPLIRLTSPLILASQSPRRRTLLNQLEVPFSVEVSPADEDIEETLPPRDIVRQLASRKASPVAHDHPNALVLAADTIVTYKGDVLNKPESLSEARRTLARLSNDTHTVYTGVALHHANTDRKVDAVKATNVTFGPLSDDEIDAYVDTESPLDKAGSYGIQDHTGPLFIEELDGDYYNVVGLPLRTVYLLLSNHFNDLIGKQ